MDSTSALIAGVIVALVLGTVLYFLPTFIAFRRNHAYRWVIFAINMAFGVSGVGWLVALVWAVYPQEKSLADPFLGNPTGTGGRNVGHTLAEVGSARAQTEHRRRRPEESASAIEAISKLAGLMEKGLISWADFDKKKEELLSHV